MALVFGENLDLPPTVVGAGCIIMGAPPRLAPPPPLYALLALVVVCWHGCLYGAAGAQIARVIGDVAGAAGVCRLQLKRVPRALLPISFKPLDLEQSCQASSEHRVRTRPVLHARLCVIFIMTYSTLAIRNFCAPPVAAAPSAGGSGAAPRRQPARSAARRKREVLSAQRKTFTKRKWVLRVSETVQRERTPLSSQAAY